MGGLVIVIEVGADLRAALRKSDCDSETPSHWQLTKESGPESNSRD